MLNSPTELTINATAFKARCLGLMDDLARGKLKRVIVTKRGKPVAEMGEVTLLFKNAPIADDGKYPSIWGCMVDEPYFQPDFDLKAIQREKAALADQWLTPQELDKKFQKRLS
jgi:hypothetical protein